MNNRSKQGGFKMLVKTITDETNGKRWEIFKKSDKNIFINIYEFWVKQ